MSLGRKFLEDVAGELRGDAKAWWETHGDDLAALGQEDAQEILESLRAGRTVDAKLALVSNMSRAEWKAYRDGTTATLEGIAQRRAKMLDALAELGVRIAETIGRVALAALGL